MKALIPRDDTLDNLQEWEQKSGDANAFITD